MAWADYERVVCREWAKLLSNECPESAVQDFLERHPCMVPRAGHDPRLPVLVSQPRLPGWRLKVPDFLWIGHDSLSVYAVLVEIEKPSKRIFRKDGGRTRDFTQAQDQLRDWRVWFADANNQIAFLEHYGVQWHLGWPGRSFGAEYVLVYGRRSEFDGSPELAKARLQQQPSGEHHMTFDRLKPEPWLSEIVSVRDRPEGLQALHIPPTLTLGPMHAVERLRIGGLEQAISSNRYLSPGRRRFLLERLPYWNEWARGPHEGPLRLGDHE